VIKANHFKCAGTQFQGPEQLPMTDLGRKLEKFLPEHIWAKVYIFNKFQCHLWSVFASFVVGISGM